MEQTPLEPKVTDRRCFHCGHTWEQTVTTEELRKIIFNEPIGDCPRCLLPT